ncbi:hypothetical protein DPMN_006203 [Dreissena polymorpha]|uniref:Uncharacterized protein n=1 Tax=Dreissena polymorpha TaxID=45954 RepID=A0A9D4RV68_DREPO|nr:hypothetical protein DPMN_006203 [Dreissena polymorpha]
MVQARSQGFEKGSANCGHRRLLLSNEVAKGVCAGGDVPLLQSGALEVLPLETFENET